MKVFLTGASSGIGEALAREYAAQGAILGLVARKQDRLEAFAASLPGAGHLALVADVGDPAAMRAAARRFIEVHGLPDIVIANAGISVGVQTEYAEDYEVFASVLRTNVLGPFATFQPFVKAFRERGSGTLVGIASCAGFRGLAGAGAYSASKAAVIRYLESLRVELHGSGVAVVTIVPGYIRTPLTAVNPYRMPFLIDADEAARRFLRAIARKASYAVIPWQMAIVMRLLLALPNRLFDRLFSRARRKPRQLPT